LESGDDPFVDYSGTANLSSNGSLDFDISGTAETSNVAVTIAEGSTFSISDVTSEETLVFNYVSNDEVALEYIDTALITDVELNLAVSIEEQAAVDPSNFEGNLNISMGVIDAEFTDSYVEQLSEFSDFDESYTEDISITDLALTLNGSFSKSGESFNASLIANTDLNFAIEERFSSTSQTGYSFSSTTEYSDRRFTLLFGIDLAGIPDGVLVTLSANETGLETAELDLNITYPGHQFDFVIFANTESETADLVLTNQDGVTLTAVETDNGLIGNISMGDTEYATIEDNGIPVIRYVDDTFESF